MPAMTGPTLRQDRPTPSAGRAPVALTIGKFDGVHLGHRQLVARLREEAARLGVLSTVLILHPDPVTVLAGRPVPVLCLLPERRRRLEALGVDVIERLEFTPEVAQLTPDAFLERLARRWQLRALVVGSDFALGRDRSGDLGALHTLGREHGFEVVVVPPLTIGDERVSSGWVRELVATGEVEQARALLLAPPQVVGTVVHGAARGRELGFPTANLALGADFVVPANGIYTARARWSEEDGGPERGCDSVASVGVRPTFDNGERIVEVFLLDFQGDLYGCELTVDFLHRQRPELRFESVEPLIAQMHEDVATARATLAAERQAGRR